MKKMFKNAQEKLNAKVAKVTAAVTMAATTIGLTFCEPDIDTMFNNIINFLYGTVLKFAGSIALGVGIIIAAGSYVKEANGDSGHQGGVTKGVSIAVLGAIMICVRSVLKKIMG